MRLSTIKAAIRSIGLCFSETSTVCLLNLNAPFKLYGRQWYSVFLGNASGQQKDNVVTSIVPFLHWIICNIHDWISKLIIHKEQAETVRLIYEMSASGASLARISAYLEDMGIPSPRGKEVWSKETLRKILSNEKYKGSVTLQKTFVENYLEHKQIKNIGQLDIYQIDYNHKPILYVDSWTQETGVYWVLKIEP